MLLSCVDYIQQHFALSNFEVLNYFVPVRKKDIPLNLFNPSNDYKSKSYILFDSDRCHIYIAFKSNRGFCYFRSRDTRLYPCLFDSFILGFVSSNPRSDLRFNDSIKQHFLISF